MSAIKPGQGLAYGSDRRWLRGMGTLSKLLCIAIARMSAEHGGVSSLSV